MSTLPISIVGVCAYLHTVTIHAHPQADQALGPLEVESTGLKPMIGEPEELGFNGGSMQIETLQYGGSNTELQRNSVK